MKFSERYTKAVTKIFNLLPEGGVQKIATELNISRRTVWRVKRCEVVNFDVLRTAKEIIKRHQQEKERQMDSIINFAESLPTTPKK